MNPFAIPSLVSACCCTALALLLHLRASHSRSARMFSVLLTLMAAEALIEFGYRISANASQAHLCWQLNVHWPLVLAVLLHFTLLSVREGPRRISRSSLWLIYGPAALFVVLEASAHLITGPPQLAWWGWTYGPPENKLVRDVAYVWVLLVMIGSAATMIAAWRKADDPVARTRFGCMAIGYGIMALGVPLEIGFSVLGIRIPPLCVAAYALAVLPIGYGVMRHDLFRMSPAAAADGIISALRHALFLVTPDGRVRFANPSALHALGRAEVELIGCRVASLFAEAPHWVKDLDAGKLDARAEPKDVEATLRGPDGGTVRVLLSGACVLNSNGQLRGVALIGYDISELKATTAELERYRDHLEALVRDRTAAIRAAYDRLEEEMAERRLAQRQRSSLQEQLLESQQQLASVRPHPSDRP